MTLKVKLEECRERWHYNTRKSLAAGREEVIRGMHTVPAPEELCGHSRRRVKRLASSSSSRGWHLSNGVTFDGARVGTMMAVSSICVLGWSLWLRHDLSKVVLEGSKIIANSSEICSTAS